MDVTEQNIERITPHVIGILDDWKFDSSQIITILGLDGLARSRQVRKYRQRAEPLPFSEKTAQHIDHISGIADALRTAFPFGVSMQYMWLHRGHRRFGGKSPAEVMLAEGLNGLLRVRVELDCAYGWTLSDGGTEPT